MLEGVIVAVEDKICAGIVLYNPELNLLKKNINSIYNQVNKIIVVDNDSSNKNDLKKILSNLEKVELHFENENRGIAFALNEILKIAVEGNYKWCLTLDQDSICDKNLIKNFKPYLSKKRIALISPFILNNGKISFEEYLKLKLPKFNEIINPIDCITSGTLNNVEIVNSIGGFNELLFIDFVDTELNCKVLENNYKILRINTTFLIQQMGKAKHIPLFRFLYKLTKKNIFKRMSVVAVYTNERLYYSSRNSRYLRRNYENHGFRTSFIFMFMYYCFFSIFYPYSRNRIEMWKKILKGFLDFKKMSR
nr:glycosyltransferase [Liquorilactobacillus sicerae]